MSFLHFLKSVMNFLKGVVSICQPGPINGFDAFKLSIDVSLVTPVLAKTISPTWGNKSRKHLTAETSANVVDSLYAQICLRTSNLLDSYSLKIFFSEASLDIRTSSFVYDYCLRKV